RLCSRRESWGRPWRRPSPQGRGKPPWRRCNKLRGRDAAAKNLGTHGAKEQRDEKNAKGREHDEQGPQHRLIDTRPAHAKKALTLLQRVPPVDREFDDRDIYRPNEDEDRRDAAGARWVFEGAP